MMPFLNLFRRKPEPRGDVWIGVYVSMLTCELTEAEKLTRARIAQALHQYQERMVAFADERAHRYSVVRRTENIEVRMDFGFKRLQQVEGFWNPDTNHIRVYGRGDRSFAWEGTAEQFLSRDLLLDAA